MKETTAQEFVLLKQLADELGMDRSFTRRYVMRQEIVSHKRRGHESQNQLALAVTVEEAEIIRRKRHADGFLSSSKPIVKEVGTFYVVQLVPELDPHRIKLGFAEDLTARLAQHRTAAPTAVVFKFWPCKRSWESTVMDCLSAKNCRLILNEVFECDDLDLLRATGDELFSVLPNPSMKVQLASMSPHNT